MAREDAAADKDEERRTGGEAGSARSEGRRRIGGKRSRWLNREEIECSSNIEEDSGFARIVSVPSAFGFLGRASASSAAYSSGVLHSLRVLFTLPACLAECLASANVA